MMNIGGNIYHESAEKNDFLWMSDFRDSYIQPYSKKDNYQDWSELN